MHIPLIVYPDREHIAGWSHYGWDVKPAPPRIADNLAFLTSADAVSHAEGFMGYVEAFRLREVVGSPGRDEQLERAFAIVRGRHGS
ncbi:MAG: hypothetical protein IAG13_18035 [Deltaproteobacteria bacterium]|nr:hypothetical protein [Nannocystaceae bacterium]